MAVRGERLIALSFMFSSSKVSHEEIPNVAGFSLKVNITMYFVPDVQKSVSRHDP